MTLARQLAAAVLGIIVVVAVGSAWIEVHFTRVALEQQFRIQALQIANALRISLTPHIELRDTSAMGPYVDQFFGRGDVLEIAVQDARGYPIVRRASQASARSVPGWFVAAVALGPFEARRSISSGPDVVGSVLVRLDPAPIYLELWLALLGSLIWLAILSAAATLLTMLGLRRWLGALWEIEARAALLAPERDPVAKSRGRGRGLDHVVRGMDDLVERLQRQFEKQNELVESVRARLLRDPITGLGTKEDFDERVAHLFETPDNLPGTAIVLMRLGGLPPPRPHHGRSMEDRLLSEAGELIRGSYIGEQPWFTARLGVQEFALLVNGIGTEEGRVLAASLDYELACLCRNLGVNDKDTVRVGMAVFRTGDRPSDFLGRARGILDRDQFPADPCEHDPPVPPSRDAVESRLKLDLGRALRERRVQMHYQPLIGFDGRGACIHAEALSRIESAAGELLPAQVFLPIANSLRRTSELDRVVLRRVLEDLEHRGNTELRVAVNLAPASIQDEMLLEWACRALSRRPHSASRLEFEMHEYGIRSSLEDFQHWIERLRPMGCRFGIDHFGRGFTSSSYLRALTVDYVKIDGSYSRGIGTNRSNQVALQGLVGIARQAGVEVYAEAVETEEEWRTLRLLGFTGAQGRFLGQPRELASSDRTDGPDRSYSDTPECII